MWVGCQRQTRREYRTESRYPRPPAAPSYTCTDDRRAGSESQSVMKISIQPHSLLMFSMSSLLSPISLSVSFYFCYYLSLSLHLPFSHLIKTSTYYKVSFVPKRFIVKFQKLFLSVCFSNHDDFYIEYQRFPKKRNNW